MKKMKFLSAILCLSIFLFAACEKEDITKDLQESSSLETLSNLSLDSQEVVFQAKAVLPNENQLNQLFNVTKPLKLESRESVKKEELK